MSETFIDKNDNVYIPTRVIAQGVYDICKECGEKLFGGERLGEDANGYCDTCNNS